MPETPGSLQTTIEACTLCAEHLPHSPRPVTSWHPKSRILVIGQAPGRAVHESGVPWNDPSGRLLRQWLNCSEQEFYNPELFALMPMGFCYPGKGTSGDLPPRAECAPAWHGRILGFLKQVEITLLIGRYAQQHYLGDRFGPTLTESVKRYRDFLPEFLPLPHPSPRNRRWLADRPWFEEEVVPELRQRVDRAIRRS